MQTIPGVSKIIYKSVAGSAFDADVEVDGHDVGTDSEVLLEAIATATSKGGVRHQGNRSFDFALNIFNADKKADIEAHKNIWGDLEIYAINDTDTPALTIENVNPLVNDRVQFDPEDDSGAYFVVQHQGVNVA